MITAAAQPHIQPGTSPVMTQCTDGGTRIDGTCHAAAATAVIVDPPGPQASLPPSPAQTLSLRPVSVSGSAISSDTGDTGDTDDLAEVAVLDNLLHRQIFSCIRNDLFLTGEWYTQGSKARSFSLTADLASLSFLLFLIFWFFFFF